MNNPTDLKYTETHEWLRKEGQSVVIGLTRHAEEQLGDVVTIDLPDITTGIHASDDMCVIESKKTAVELYAPVSGDIIAINTELEEAPGLVNSDPYGDGWLYQIQVKDWSEYDLLMTAAEYLETLTV